MQILVGSSAFHLSSVIFKIILGIEAEETVECERNINICQRILPVPFIQRA